MRACKLFIQLLNLFAFFFLLATKFVSANTSINIPNIDIALTDVTIDGELNESVWLQAKEIDLNIVNFPRNNTPSPLSTKAKIFENGHELYIAFIAHDPNPKEILAYYGDRDTRWDDDVVGIKIDPQNNHRLNYEFIVNPLGMQIDAIQNHTTGEKNDLWNGIWFSHGKMTQYGYTVEMVIPLNVFNFDDKQKVKQWPIELFRLYPRDTWLRISHVPLDRNIACITCQYPLATGFKQVKTHQQFMLAPYVVLGKNQHRDVFQAEPVWQSDYQTEVGADIRWEIDKNTRINATINPDFSFVETDNAQLNVNENFALNFPETRPFFLENNQYFSSNLELIYTRNIVEPDYGVKITGAKNNHTYGAFYTSDQQTQFILPGNLSSDIAILNQQSQSAALKYRYDIDNNLSLGAISTLRKADNYHNYLFGFDTKYQLSETNSVLAQYLISNTAYPDDFFLHFCLDEPCIASFDNCDILTCALNEQVLRSQKTDNFTDQAYKIDFQHRSEYWDFDASHQQIGQNFRADLGFLPQIDYQQDELSVNRKFFSEDEHSFWQEAKLSSNWFITHNEQGELIEKSLSATAAIDGPYQSNFEVTYTKANEVGLREDQSILLIDNNTSRFELNKVEVFTAFRPANSLYLELIYRGGDEIDFIHDRLGDIKEWESYFSWFVTKHLQLEVTFVDSQLDHLGDKVFKAAFIDTRISYQFDARSQLKR